VGVSDRDGEPMVHPGRMTMPVDIRANPAWRHAGFMEFRLKDQGWPTLRPRA